MKVKTLFEISLYLLIFYGVNIGYQQMAFAQNKFPEPLWSLETEDTYIAITIINNRPAICDIKNKKNGWDWIKEFSLMPLPEIVLSGNKSYRPDWKYKEAAIEKENGTKLTLRFFSTIPNLELESVWEAKPGVGPVENMVSVKNNSGGSIVFKNASAISSNITLTADSAISLWRFNKARYLGLKFKLIIRW